MSITHGVNTYVLPVLLGVTLTLYLIFTGRLKTMSGQGKQEFIEDEELSKLCERLWELDENRLDPREDYELDIGGRTRFSYDGPDRAEDPLFTKVESKVFQKPTYKAFLALLDNYERETGVAETVTPEEEKENRRFIDEICKTKVMREAMSFLASKGKIDKNVGKGKMLLYDLWFNLYRRTRQSREKDSSGFEHVFVGETRGKTSVIGFHNWIQFYLQEKIGNVDYKGFMASGKNPHLLTVQFSWKGEVKPKGSMFIGTSPEFEVALYTVVHILGYSSVKIRLMGDEVILKCHKNDGKMGTCYPVAVEWSQYRK